MIEAGHLDGPLVRQTLKPLLDPLRRQNVDTVVLGCTHYPFLTPVMRDLLDDHVDIVDPGKIMGRRLQRNNENSPTPPVRRTFAATGETTSLRTTLTEDLGYNEVTVREVSTEGTVQS
jgi:glutamate racemase